MKSKNFEIWLTEEDANKLRYNLTNNIRFDPVDWYKCDSGRYTCKTSITIDGPVNKITLTENKFKKVVDELSEIGIHVPEELLGKSLFGQDYGS
jgi:hypothetical protein